MFDGDTYLPLWDRKRLTSLLERVRAALSDGCWHSLAHLCEVTGGTSASVSARVRDLRKDKFGGFDIERRRMRNGVHEYRMVIGDSAVGSTPDFDSGDPGSSPGPRAISSPDCGSGQAGSPADVGGFFEGFDYEC